MLDQENCEPLDGENRIEEHRKGSKFPIRYLVVLAAFLLNATFYVQRVNLSVAIVAIALDTSHAEITYNGTDISNHTDIADLAPKYEWEAAARSTVLSSFFWGYTVAMFPSTFLIGWLGPRRLGLLMALVSSLATFLFVPAAALGWQWACAARIALGLAQGGLIPSSTTLLARWAPPRERARMATYTYTGHLFGTTLGLSATGLLSSWLGWPCVFYLMGALGLLVSIVWVLLVADTPQEHRMASIEEKEFIVNSIALGDGSKPCTKRNLQTPWISILTSKPFLALTAAQCVQAWGFWTLLAGIPSYLNGVLHFKIAKDGLVSSLPYLAMWISGLLFTWTADRLIKIKLWGTTASRKIFNSIAQYGGAAMLLILAFSDADPITVVALLTASTAFGGAGYSSMGPNYIDLAPNFAGVIKAIGNTMGCIMSIIGPLLIGFIVTDNSSAVQWRDVFLIAAGLYIIGNSIYIIFGSAKVQPWNDPQWPERSAEPSYPKTDRENL